MKATERSPAWRTAGIRNASRSLVLPCGVLLILSLAGVSTLQWYEGRLLESELRILDGELRELSGVREENTRLTSRRISPEELQNLRVDHETVARLRTEVEALRRRIAAPGR
jgi:hypothetical protein